MRKTCRKFTSEFKSKVAIEALKERYSLSELAERFELHPNQISQWKQEFLEKSEDIFGNYPVAFTLGISTILLMASKTGCPFLIAVSTMERSMANSC